MRNIVAVLVLVVWGSSPVTAQSLPRYSASPSATLVPANPTSSGRPTVSAAPNELVCESLAIVSGNNSLAPAEVRFNTSVSGDTDLVKRYIYHFGDGRVEEYDSPEVSHRYTNAGSFEVFVEVEDMSARVVTSENCKQTVTIQNPPLVRDRTECAEIVVEGDNTVAPATVTFTINGYTSQGTIPNYKFDIEELPGESTKSVNIFEWTFDKPGTYRVKGYVQDPESKEYVGGTNLCQKQVRILGEGLTSQPETGVPILYWVVIWGVLAVGLLARKLAIGGIEEKFGKYD